VKQACCVMKFFMDAFLPFLQQYNLAM
jgi:hypothetical protein